MIPRARYGDKPSPKYPGEVCRIEDLFCRAMRGELATGVWSVWKSVGLRVLFCDFMREPLLVFEMFARMRFVGTG